MKNSLLNTVRLASALGLLSVSLTGEMAPAWIILSWTAWGASFLCDRSPEFQTRFRRWETIAVVGMIMTLFLDFFVFHSTIFEAITHFLLLFQIVKLLGQKTRKDSFQIFLFSFFQILAACTLSVDVWHAVVLLALIPTATAGLFWNQIEREGELAGAAPDPLIYRRYWRMSAGICGAALPLNLMFTLIVFVIFPRLTLNASLPGFSGHHAGYTDQVNLAQKGNLEQDNTVVLWLNFPKMAERAQWDGYLRGEVLNQFNGKEWTVSKNSPSRLLRPDGNEMFIIRRTPPTPILFHQSITLADPSAATLFMIGSPVRIKAPLPALQENQGGTLHWLASWRRPLQYEAVSVDYSDMESGPSDLQIPSIPLARVRTLTHKVAGNGSPEQKAQNIQDYLQNNYRYSLHYGDQIPDNPVDYFLFEQRAGPCGHFASAMALMLRLENIPSRVAAGYLKGEWNEPAQAIVVKARDAHAWVEAYLPNKGWVSFDPAPIPAAGTERQMHVLLRIAQYWDYLGLQWNRFVIQYDLYTQIRAFENIKGSLPFSLKHSTRYPVRAAGSEPESSTTFPIKKVSLFFCLAGVSFFWLARKDRHTEDSTVGFYRQFLDRMARAGHPKRLDETGQEFAKRLRALKFKESASAQGITDRYYRIRFGGKLS